MMGVACHLIAFIQGDQQRTCCYFLGILNVIFAFCVSPPPPPPQRSSVSPEKDCPVFCLERICHSALQRPSCLRGLDAKGAFLDTSQIPTSHCHASFLSSTGMISCPKTLALVLPEGNLARGRESPDSSHWGRGPEGPAAHFAESQPNPPVFRAPSSHMCVWFLQGLRLSRCLTTNLLDSPQCSFPSANTSALALQLCEICSNPLFALHFPKLCGYFLSCGFSSVFYLPYEFITFILVGMQEGV